MKNTYLIFYLLLAAFSSLPAQSYNTAIGMRLGTDWGITAQQRLTNHLTVEGILQSSLQREEVVITGLVEKHMPLIFRRVNVYFGGGLHKGWINNKPEEQEMKDPYGVSLIGGIEMTLGKLNLSYDFKPAVNFSGGEQTVYTQTGISMRYVIAKRKRTNQKKKEGFNWKIWQKK